MAAPSPVTREPIAIVGLLGGQWFGSAAEAALRAAGVLIGHAEQFALLPDDIPGERLELWGDLGAVIDRAVAERDAGRRPCILAAGDPGFHGMVRVAARRLGEEGIAVHPAPSSIALAFARLGTGWDDATVASLHGQPLDEVVATVVDHPTVAVLTSRRYPPEALGAALVGAGCDDRRVAVCSRLAEPGETVVRTDLAGLAAGTFDPLSVVVVRRPPGGGC
ncbi:MAG TPA: precorrin-6y C5,15-methyltransferase (decarboxylating) subunit CbiE [Acidimicrobiales bacterium]